MHIKQFSALVLSCVLVALLYIQKDAPIVPETTTQWYLPHGALRLDQVHFLGAHNALISRRPTTQWGTFLYAQQTWNLHEQLKHGVRAFELDLGAEHNKLVLCHKQSSGIYGLQKIGPYESFEDIMHCFARWLDEHPQEIIILLIDSRDPTIQPHMVDTELREMSDVRKHILTQTMWDPDNRNGLWPTINWMRTYNKRMIIFNDRIDDSPRHTFHHWSYVMCTPPHNADHDGSSFLRHECNKHTKSHAQLYQLNHFAGVADNRVAWLFTIGTTLLTNGWYRPRGFHGPDNNVDHISSIINYGKRKKFARGKNPNFLMLDNVDRFVCNDGLALINEWNQEAVINKS